VVSPLPPRSVRHVLTRIDSNRGRRALIKSHPISMLLTSRLVIDVPMFTTLSSLPLVVCPTCNHIRNTSSRPTTVCAKGIHFRDCPFLAGAGFMGPAGCSSACLTVQYDSWAVGGERPPNWSSFRNPRQVVTESAGQHRRGILPLVTVQFQLGRHHTTFSEVGCQVQLSRLVTLLCYYKVRLFNISQERVL
jgi:hypothetical protein